MRKLFRVGVASAVAIACATSNPNYTTHAATAGTFDLSASNITELIYERALAHRTAPGPLLCVLSRESGLNPNFVGSHGEVGLSQWLPGRGNAWDFTSAYKVSGISIFREYARENPDAIYFDVDAAAELFSRGSVVRKQHWYSTLSFCE